ncbi:DUF4190 domain-containing protein [Bifidobacterium pullorum subsp. saeculare]|uniref:DUF4190 domain-containing protein n=1 Tax=Bifidobacterium pullorum subsp. saeculare TaxID=78257 RepID=A0A939B956_9BIFI|nr:DUF4190 domain-containing protein [Bifidobacterium pullorum]MBM6699124.1 DUF4190 domain-containing protein [Bifidobacterium pullorum subsp. saeculare]
MTEPHTPQDAGPGQGTAPQDSAPRQNGRPEYGAMASDYPGYDPYLYGRPEPPRQSQGQPGPVPAAPAPAGGGAVPPAAPQPGAPQGAAPFNPYPYGAPEPPQGPANPGQAGQRNPYGAPGYGQPNQPTADGHTPDWRYGIDMADPNQNPLYGKWDLYAILALVFSVFFVPGLPALMGGMAMWRTKTFHMRGFGLALAAVILNVLMTLVWLWMLASGMSASDLTAQLLGSMGGSGGSDGSGSEQTTLSA